jgi:hypothetical protein
MKTYGEWRYSATILDLSTRWRWVVRLHALAALPPGKSSSVSIGYVLGWDPEPVWTLWRREQSCLCRDLNSGYPTHSPSLYQLSYPDSYERKYVSRFSGYLPWEINFPHLEENREASMIAAIPAVCCFHNYSFSRPGHAFLAICNIIFCLSRGLLFY